MIAFVILAIICLSLAVISFVDAPDAYSSLPMLLLWGALAVVSVYYLIKRHSVRTPAVLLFHLSFILILVGALITHLSPEPEMIHLREGERASCDGLDISLIDFNITYYPGTSTPCDYSSRLEIDGQEALVSMNNVASVGRHRIFQSAYDADSRGSVILVSSDFVGRRVTYVGYGLLALAMLWMIIKRYCRRLRLVALLLPLAFGAAAAPRSVSPAVADALGQLFIYQGGRIRPFGAYARDFSVKVTGSASYKGLSSGQILAGWLFYYDSWKDEPCIKVRDKNVRQALGTSHASLADLISVESSKTLEQVTLVSTAATGSLWRIFPVVTSEKLEWLSPVDSQPADVGFDEWHFTRHCLNYLARLIAEGNETGAIEVINKIAKYQRNAANDVLPSLLQRRCEVLFSTLAASIWPALILLVGGFLILLFSLRYGWILACAGCLWTIFIILLNWIASGSVPMSNGYETMQWIAFAACCGGVLAMKTSPLSGICCVVSGLALAVALMGQANPAITPVVPVLRSPLLSLHVLTVMLAYTGFAIIALCSGAYLCGRHHLLFFSRQLLLPSVFLLTAGIFIGAIWADRSWGRYWGWDPKEVWALITMLIYSFPLHKSLLPRFARPRAFAFYTLLAFITVLITYFGVNFFLHGLHSYA